MELVQNLVFSFGVVGMLLFIALVIIPNKALGTMKFFFASFIALQTANIFYAYLIVTDKYVYIPNLLNINHLLQVCSPILIYLLSYSIVHPKSKFTAFKLLYFLPVLVVFLLNLPFYTLDKDLKIQEIYQILHGTTPSRIIIINIIKLINGIIFISLSFMELKKYHEKLFDFYAEFQNKTHLWLRNSLIYFFVIWLLATILKFFANDYTTIYFLSISVGLMVYYIGVNYLLYIIPYREEIENTFGGEKDISKAIPKDYSLQKEQFLKIMHAEKLYLNPDCNLTFVAAQTDLKTYVVSGIIKNELKTTFYDFINELRVKEASKLLLDIKSEQYTIDAIANSCGFKSKATFYKSFKHFFDCTPTQYKRNQVL